MRSEEVHFQKDLKGQRLETYCDVFELRLLLHHLDHVGDDAINGTKLKIGLESEVVNHVFVEQHVHLGNQQSRHQNNKLGV